MIIGADISPETEVFTSDIAHFIDFPLEVYLISKTENNEYTLTYKSKVIKKLEGRDGRLILRFQYNDPKDTVAIYYFNEYLIDYLQYQKISKAKSIKRYAASATFEQEIELFNTLLTVKTNSWDSRLQKICVRSYFSQTITYEKTEIQKKELTAVDSGSLAELVAVAANTCSQQPTIIPIEMYEFGQLQHILKSQFHPIISKRQLNKIQESDNRHDNFLAKAISKIQTRSLLTVTPISMWSNHTKNVPPSKESLDTAQFTQNGIVCNISYEAIAACMTLDLSAAELKALIPDNVSVNSANRWEDWNLFIFFACFSKILKTSNITIIVDGETFEIGLEETATEIVPPKRSPLKRKFHQVSELCKKWAINSNTKCKVGVENA